MSIKTAVVRNFQSWKDVTLELHPGINIITGVTDSGKSALFRALRWVLTNEPRGADFRSSWAQGRGDSTLVDVETAEGSGICRVRSTSRNQYILDGEELTAFSTSLPEDVADAVRMNDTNWQGQHDAAFMLSESPAAVARRLNAVAHLESIETATSNINTMLLQTQQTVRRLEAHKDKVKTGLASLPDIDADREVLEDVRKQVAALHDNGKKLLALEQLLAAVRETDEELKGLLLPTEQEQAFVLSTTRELARISQGSRKCQEIRRALLELQEVGEELKTLFVPEPEARRCLEADVFHYGKLADRSRETARLLDELVAVERLIQTAQAQHETRKAQFELTFPEVCPLCGAPKEWR